MNIMAGAGMELGVLPACPAKGAGAGTTVS